MDLPAPVVFATGVSQTPCPSISTWHPSIVTDAEPTKATPGAVPRQHLEGVEIVGTGSKTDQAKPPQPTDPFCMVAVDVGMPPHPIIASCLAPPSTERTVYRIQRDRHTIAVAQLQMHLHNEQAQQIGAALLCEHFAAVEDVYVAAVAQQREALVCSCRPHIS